MYDFSTPNWKQIGDMQQEIDMLHAKNALKLTQILGLEQILYKTSQYRMYDGSPCWCDRDGNLQHDVEHDDYCADARQATEPFWKGIKT